VNYLNVAFFAVSICLMVLLVDASDEVAYGNGWEAPMSSLQHSQQAPPPSGKAAEGIAASRCGLHLTVSGGSFSPDTCRIEVITGGPKCGGGDQGCNPDIAITLRTMSRKRNEISSIVLNHIPELAKASYRFDPEQGVSEFSGQLIDQDAVARHLKRGKVSLEPQGSNQIYIAFDVLFDQKISVHASGLLNVIGVSAP
jgi:hypothetical protein